MGFEIRVSQNGDGVMIDIGGRLTLGEASNRLRDVVLEQIQRGNNRLLLNLEKVSYVDSGGLGQLVGCYTTVTQRGGEMKLTRVSERVASLMELTQLSGVFSIAEIGSNASTTGC